jgi:hypothetical protein
VADYERIEITTRRVIHRVRGPVPLDELGKAIQAARLECAQKKGVEPSKLYGDALMVETFDQDIHIYFDYEVGT